MTTRSGTGRHVAVVTFSALGHVTKSLAISAELVRRGHRVTCAVGEQFSALARATGAVPVIYRATIDPEPSAATWFAITSGAEEMFLNEADSMLTQLEPVYRNDRPDLFLYKAGCWPAPVLATKWHIPAIQFSSTRIPIERAIRVAPDPFQKKFAQLLVDHGIDISPQEFAGRPEPCMVLVPRSFQIRADEVPGNYTFVGPCLGDRSFQGRWHPPDDRPVLLITLGSVFTDRPDFYRRCIAAFSGGDWTVVMAVGRHVRPADLGAVPANFEIRRSVPQLAVLAQARAFLSHCGMGGMMEALYHGVPIVGVPQAADQFENAGRLAELGLGVQLPAATATAEQLRAAVQRVSTGPEIARRVAAIRREIRAAGGTRAAADLIEQLMAPPGDAPPAATRASPAPAR